MGKLKTKSKAKITRYIPILLILLSITIMIGSTFAYFTDKADESSSLTFSKVELSSETTVGIDGKIGDALPGTPLVDSPISFSKAIDSEAIYVRAKISFSLPSELEDDEKMVELIDILRDSSDFNIKSDIQNDAVWSEKQGEYFYLLDSANTDNLKRVDTIDVYTLSDSIIIPRDLKQLDENYQYMKSVNFHIAFEAIQADNVDASIESNRKLFHSIFPNPNGEIGSFTVTIMNKDLQVKSVEVKYGSTIIEEPNIDLPLDEYESSTHVVAGWYTDEGFTNKFDFTQKISENVTLYPRVLEVSQGLQYSIVVEDSTTYNLRNSNNVSLSVSKGSCTDTVVVIPDYYLGTPVKYLVSGFSSSMTEIVLPNTVTSIGGSTFSSCSQLEKINLPNSLQTIGSDAFYNCSKLSQIELPEGLISIGANAFRNCTSLTNVVIPDSLEKMGANPFLYCNNINFEVKNNQNFKLIGGCLVDINTNKVLIASAGSNIDLTGIKEIDAYAFYNRSDLTEIVLPNTLVNIGDYAFYGCSNLTNIVIPNSIEVLGNRIFYGCSNLTSVTIGNSVKSIGDYAFYGCSNLASVVIPKSVETLGDSLFYNCSNLTSVTIGNSVETIGNFVFYGCSNLASVVIPDSVETLGHYVFYNCSNLTSVQLSNKLTEISNHVFYGCTSLKNIELPSSIKTINSSAFYNCKALENINLPDGLETIEDSAFSNCTSLTSLVIPESVTKLGSNVISYCSKIESFEIPEGVTEFGGFSYCTNLKYLKLSAVNASGISYNSYNPPFKDTGKNGGGIKLVIGANVERIPDYFSLNYITSIEFEDGCKNLTEIGRSALCYLDIDNLELPNTVINIVDGAFSDGLFTSINLHEELQQIGRNSFANCYYVTQIFYNSKNVEDDKQGGLAFFSNIGKNASSVSVVIGSNVERIPVYLFYGAQKITSITFEEDSKCTEIGASAFGSCKITSIELPTSLIRIENSVFRGTNLTSITIPESIEYIGDYAFYYCQSLASVEVLGNIKYIGNYAFYYTNITSISLLEGLEYIGDYAFYYTKLTSITLPESLEYIGAQAFYNTSLTSINIPKNVNYIGSSAFNNNKNLVEIKYNAIHCQDLESNSNVFQYAGSNASGITVTIGKNVIRIPNYLFYSSSPAPKITTVIFEEDSQCVSIGYRAFYNLGITVIYPDGARQESTYYGDTPENPVLNNGSVCYQLIEDNKYKILYKVSNDITEIVWPENVVEIADNAFKYCNNLTSVEIPNTVTTIGLSAFEDCDNLSSVTISDSVTEVKGAIFKNCENLTTVRLSNNLTYISASMFYNCNKLTSIDIPDSVTIINNYGFYSCTSLTQIQLSQNLIEIGNYAFSSCNAISINFPAGVAIIGEEAFYNCDNLEGINLNEGLIEIGQEAFYNCDKLTSVKFPNTVTTIGYRAFYNCISLNNITLSRGITSIGDYAFGYCKSLKEVEYNIINLNNTYDDIFVGAGQDVGGFDVIIGADVESIPDYFFYCNTTYNEKIGVKSVTFEEGSKCESIGKQAFCNNSLRSFIIPESIKVINSSAFSGCEKLFEVINLSNLDIEIGATTHGRVAYYAKDVFTAIGESKYISENGFVFYDSQAGVDYLVGYVGNETQITLPATFNGEVYEIASNAFRKSKITSVTIPNTIQEISHNAFSDCVDLCEVIFEENSACFKIDSYAFSGCKQLKEIELPESLKVLGSYAFENCVLLKEIKLPESLNNLGSSAFIGCQQLKEIIIPNSLHILSNSAFKDCSALSKVVLPSEIVYIDSGVFANCLGLQTITLPRKLLNIGYQAFYGCLNLLEVVNFSKLNVTIGDSNNGYVAYYAKNVITDVSQSKIYVDDDGFVFYNDNGSILLISYIGDEEDIVLPNYNNGDYSIYQYAFYKNTTIKTVDILDSIKVIGAKAFYGCENLTKINIPESTTSIGSSAFAECVSLSEIEYDAQSLNDFTSNGYFTNAGKNVDGIKLIISANVERIPAYLFKNSRLNEISFVGESKCTTIGTSAFEECYYLTKITLPENLTKIHQRAFYGCYILNEINYNAIDLKDVSTETYVANGDDYYDWENDGNMYNYIFTNAGERGDGIVVNIGAKVKSIPDYLFCPYYYANGYGNSYEYNDIPNIIELNFAENGVCESIGDRAFYMCKPLAKLVLPNTITKIGANAFLGCLIQEFEFYAENITSLSGVFGFEMYYDTANTSTKVLIGANIKNLPTSFLNWNCMNIVEVKFEEGSICETIGDYAFAETNITSIDLPDTIISIGKSAFSGTNLTSFIIPSGVTVLSDNLFSYSSLTSITIHENVTSIGKEAFYNCQYLTQVNYNAKTITDLTSSSQVFYNAGKNGDGITIKIGVNVESIPAYLCYVSTTSYSPNITNIVFEEESKCVSIGTYAFYGCEKVETIVIPASMTSINSYAFQNCLGLLEVINLSALDIQPRATTHGYVAYYALGVSNTKDGSKMVFDEASNCVFFAGGEGNTYLVKYLGEETEIVLPQDYNGIAYGLYNNVFYQRDDITSITLPETLTSIGNYTFYNCYRITQITIPNTVAKIGDYAFYGCSQLTNLEISSNITSIGNYAFASCGGLISVKYNTNITNSPTSIFNNSGSYNGMELIIGKDVTQIKTSMFGSSSNYNSPSITKVIFEEGSVCTTIGQKAFQNCIDLKSIEIPENVTSIGSSAFYGCTNLIEIKYNAKSVANLSSNNQVFYNAGINKAGISVVVGAQVTRLPNYLFYPYNSTSYLPKIISVEFAEGSLCTEFGGYVLYNCTTLTSIELPASLTTLGTYALYGCTNLTEIKYNTRALANLNSNNNVFYNAGRNAAGIELVVGAEVTRLPNYIFYPNGTYYPNITSVVFEDESLCTEIGQYAFYGCAGLLSIELPESLTTLGNYAFYGCTYINEININSKALTDLANRNYAFYNAGVSGNGINVVIGSEVTNVPAYLFYPYSSTSYTPKILSVEFEEGSECTSIGAYAFYGSTSLTSIELPESLTSIGANAFYGCSKLKSIDIPNGVTAINTYTFYNCSSLESIKISESLTSIGAYAFYGCTALTSIEYNAISLTDLSSNNNVFYNAGKSGDGITVTIGSNVEKLPAYLFCSYTNTNYAPNIISIVFEEGSKCESIGNNAFAYCHNVTSIELPNSVTTIGAQVFYYCTSLTTIIIPDNVTSIDNGAFQNCTSLTTITISNNVTSIGNNTFKDCTSLTTIIVPDNVTSIGNNAFQNCTSLTTIIVPENITSIGTYAFQNCTSLTAITIPKNVTSIGTYAFYGCSALTSIEYNAINLTNFTSNNYVFYNAGKDGDGITVTIGSEVTKIPNYLFYPYASNLPNIISVDFENGVCTSIGQYAFYNCSKINKIKIISTIRSIGTSAFQGCTSLMEVVNLSTLNIVAGATTYGYVAYYALGVYASEDESYIVSENGCIFFAGGEGRTLLLEYVGDATELVLPETFRDCTYNIKEEAFYNNTTLTSVTIPNTVTSIGANAFYGCSALTNVNIPSNLVSLGDYAFYGCPITSIELPESLTTLGKYAFYNCDKVITISYNAISLTDLVANNYTFYNVGRSVAGTTVTIGAKVTKVPAYIFNPCSSSDYSPNITSLTFEEESVCLTIGNYAFYGCSKLASVNLSNTITSIGTYAFYNCSALTSIDLPDNLQTISNYMFYGCSEITELVLPDSITTIGNYAFYGCSKLASINLHNAITSIGTHTFYNCTSLTSIDLPDNLNTISSYMFYGCGFTEFVVPDSIAIIGQYAFSNCTSLVSMNTGKNVTQIENYTFNACTALTSVTMSGTIGGIGSYAFYGCSSLTSIEIPESVSSIGSSAFYNCSALTSIIIPENVMSIGSSAYYGCTNVTEIKFNANMFDDFSSNNKVFYNVGKSGAGITLTIGANVTRLPNYIFYPYNSTSYVPKILSVEFEEGSECTSIGAYAFYGSTLLTSIELPESVLSLGEYAFYGCTALTSVEYNATTLDDLYSENYVFYNAGKNGSGINVTIGANVTKVPANLFYSSSSTSYTPKISSVEFEEGSECTSIGAYAFYNLTLLTSIELPESLTSIGNYAFQNCTSLTDITIPESLTTLGNYAFSGCYALTQINYNAISLNNLAYNNRVFYDAGMGDSGINVVIGLKVEKIPEYIFNPYGAYCPNITSVVFEEGSVCAEIGQYAFYYCSTITSISLPGTITKIGRDAFTNTGITFETNETVKYLTLANNNTFVISAINTSITEVIWPSNVVGMAGYAFYGCSSLTSFVIPDKFTNINQYTFNNCTSLTTIEFGPNIVSVGDYAFNGCSKLTTINFSGSVSEFEQIVVGTNNTPFTNATVNYFYGWTLVSRVEPTCSATGLETYEKDGQTVQNVLDKLPHTFVDGICSVCGAEALTIVNETSSGSYGFINSNGTYTSNNKAKPSSNAYATITAYKACKIVITWTVSSQANYDKFYIYVNNTIQSSVNGISGNNKTGTLTLTLAAGDVVKFRYYKNASTNNYNDCATFSYTETEIV